MCGVKRTVMEARREQNSEEDWRAAQWGVEATERGAGEDRRRARLGC